jgi:hypothetical protein
MVPHLSDSTAVRRSVRRGLLIAVAAVACVDAGIAVAQSERAGWVREPLMTGTWTTDSGRTLVMGSKGDVVWGMVGEPVTCFQAGEKVMSGRRTGAGRWSVAFVTKVRSHGDTGRCVRADPEVGTVRLDRDVNTASYCSESLGCSTLTRQRRATNRWEVRLIASGSAGAVLEVALGFGEIRRAAQEGRPAGPAYAFEYVGGGLGAGLALPLPSDSSWAPFTTATDVMEEDFDGTTCHIVSIGGGVIGHPILAAPDPFENPLGRAGYSITFITFPELSANSVYVGGDSSDVGGTAGINIGECDLPDPHLP